MTDRQQLQIMTNVFSTSGQRCNYTGGLHSWIDEPLWHVTGAAFSSWQVAKFSWV